MIPPKSSNYTTENILVNLIKRFEGYAKALKDGRCTTYLCSAGVVTIGYGSTGRDITPGVVWTREQAERRLQSDLIVFSKGVFALSPSLYEESEGKQAAIISFAYNCGLNAYRNSGLRKAVDRGDWDAAKRQLLRWNKAGGRVIKGLTIRREAEAALFNL
jgi:lysozyme